LFMKERGDEGGEVAKSGVSGSPLLISAGVLSGFAALFKQIGVLILVFFFLYEIFTLWIVTGKSPDKHRWFVPIRRAAARLSLIGVGFILVIACFALWLTSMGAFSDFWRNGVVLNKFYIDSEPPGSWLKFMFGRGLSYVFFNSVLWWLAGWAIWDSIRVVRKASGRPITYTLDAEHARFDFAMAVWAAVSLLGVVLSGRLYGHYFIPSLPALSILGARGSVLLIKMLRTPAKRVRARVVILLMSLLFIVCLLR